MDSTKEEIKEIAGKYGFRIIYAVGSRGKEALTMGNEEEAELSRGPSDLDIGVKPGRHLAGKKKAEVALACEDMFGV